MLLRVEFVERDSLLVNLMIAFLHFVQDNQSAAPSRDNNGYTLAV